MLTKTIVAAALTFGLVTVAQASGDTDHEDGGFRTLANGNYVTDGVNPAYHRSLQNCASTYRQHSTQNGCER